MKNPILKALLAGLICLPATQAFAHQGDKFDCSSKGSDGNIVKRWVDIFAQENRVQVSLPNHTFAAISDKKGGYLNVFEEAQFYPKDKSARLYLSSKQIECKKYSLFVDDSALIEPTAPVGKDIGIGRSLGGKMRDGSNMQAKQIGSLAENSQLVIIKNTGDTMNGYDWFQIQIKSSKIGYQWGGIMCSNDQKIQGIFQQCK